MTEGYRTRTRNPRYQRDSSSSLGHNRRDRMGSKLVVFRQIWRKFACVFQPGASLRPRRLAECTQSDNIRAPAKNSCRSMASRRQARMTHTVQAIVASEQTMRCASRKVTSQKRGRTDAQRTTPRTPITRYSHSCTSQSNVCEKLAPRWRQQTEKTKKTCPHHPFTFCRVGAKIRGF